jgi:hypothetical protein
VIVSLAAVAAFALGVLPALAYFTGAAGLAKFWLMPWLGYHFWMSTFTVVHHTAPHIPFKPAGEWNAARAQLSGTVHCDYPRWCAHLTIRMTMSPCLSCAASVGCLHLRALRLPALVRAGLIYPATCMASLPLHACRCFCRLCASPRAETARAGACLASPPILTRMAIHPGL